MNTLIKFGCLIGFGCAMVTPVFAGEQKVTLMLGGKFCEAYLDEVDAALAKLAGVKTVDFTSMKGHVVVTIDGEKVKEDQLTASVNGIGGDGWHCSGKVCGVTATNSKGSRR